MTDATDEDRTVDAEDKVRADFENALARLVARKPENSTLRKKARVRITPSSVALEAGHSRTLVGHARCKYPDLREKILSYREGSEKRPTRLDEIGRLKAKITELEKALQVRDTIQASILVRNRELEDEVRTARRTYARITKLRSDESKPESK